MAKLSPKRLEELQALARMMSDTAGRRWVWGQLLECHVWQPSISNNALQMAFLEGERSRGLRLLGEIQEANPDMFLQMMREFYSERRNAGSGTATEYNPIDDRDPDGDAADDIAAGAYYDTIRRG